MKATIENIKMINNLISELSNLKSRKVIEPETYAKYNEWLKELRREIVDEEDETDDEMMTATTSVGRMNQER